ncbi:MAG: hypothetical protein IJB85_09210 [Clostridia bacterium]|nr:hypothetical protein [Clostridia bacterium]
MWESRIGIRFQYVAVENIEDNMLFGFDGERDHTIAFFGKWRKMVSGEVRYKLLRAQRRKERVCKQLKGFFAGAANQRFRIGMIDAEASNDIQRVLCTAKIRRQCLLGKGIGLHCCSLELNRKAIKPIDQLFSGMLIDNLLIPAVLDALAVSAEKEKS